MKKHTIEYVRQVFEKEGYVLLSTEYIDNKHKLDVVCPQGHKVQIRFDMFNSGRRCPICFGTPKYSYQHVKETIESEKGYKLLSTEYTKKIKIQCNNNHIYETSFQCFNLQKHRCPICGSKKSLEKRTHSFEYVKDFIEKEGYVLLSTNYKNNKSKLKIQCPQGHIYNVSFNGFSRGDRCPICASLQTVSKAEKDVVDYIKKIYNGLLIENDRTQIINPKTNCFLELDIFLPDINKAIEYNGVYWHSSNYSVYKDNVKKEQCKQKNIDLLVIEENEWLTNKTNCLLVIDDFIKGTSI